MSHQDNHQPLLKEVARHIAECDFLLIATGAGFSADSNLPTYSQVARNPIYEQQGIDYGDLCRISCLKTNPSLFYGFWGSCFNAYQKAAPHAGYDILKKWCQNCQDYYIYTSNVDGHFRRKEFSTDRIHEMHGASDTWMMLQKQEDGTININEDEPPISLKEPFSFPIDANLEISPETMNKELIPLTAPTIESKSSSPLLFRPKVLMFDDGLEVHQLMGLSKSSDQYQAWEEQMETKLENNPTTKLVVLEIGCGTRVPSVRRECEDVVADTAKRAAAGASPDRFVHIRINSEEYEIESPAKGTTTIGIRGTALATLQAIDAIILANKRINV